MTLTQLDDALREAREADPDHHLWRNGRFWWIAFTVHTPDGRTKRVRFSLATEDLEEARRRRDRQLAWCTMRDDIVLAIRIPDSSR